MNRTVRRLAVILVASLVVLAACATPALAGTGPSHQAPHSPIPGTCNVTADKPTADPVGARVVVHNGCQHLVDLTISVQAQIPGAWHHGGCAAGGCHLLTRYTQAVQPGTSALLVVVPKDVCRFQVDVKNGEKLLRAAQFGTAGCKVTPTPTPTGTPTTSTPTPSTGHHSPTPRSSTSHHDTVALASSPACNPKGLACTGGFDHPVLYAGAAALLLGVIFYLAAGFRRQPNHRTH